MARYTDMAPAFVELDRRLPPAFDLNFGNVPYCTMPEVSHRIHHDGLETVTVAADGQGQTQEGFNKYEDKRTDKHKPERGRGAGPRAVDCSMRAAPVWARCCRWSSSSRPRVGP